MYKTRAFRKISSKDYSWLQYLNRSDTTLCLKNWLIHLLYSKFWSNREPFSNNGFVGLIQTWDDKLPVVILLLYVCVLCSFIF